MYLIETYKSVQGESSFAGLPCIFVRLAGCNLRCRYCDTPESLERTASCSVHGLDGSLRVIANPLEAGTLASLLEPFFASRSPESLRDFLVARLGVRAGTIYNRLGIPLDTTHHTPDGRPIQVNYDGRLIRELL